MKNLTTASDISRLLLALLLELRNNTTLSLKDVEEAGELIFQAMTGPSRCYHDLDHVCDVARHLPAVGKVAALFHDVVYISIDRGFPPQLREKIGEMIVERKGSFFLPFSDDSLVVDLRSVFGFEQGQEIQHDLGLNEHLSAAFALVELRGKLNREQIRAVLVCIEATIPFRTNPAEILGKRLAKMNLQQTEIDSLQVLAVEIANADVWNFGQPDLCLFLDKTWQLLTESHPELHQEGAYSAQSYRAVLSRIKTFLSALTPALIFRKWGDFPEENKYRQFCENCATNLHNASIYLEVMIASLAVVQGVIEVPNQVDRIYIAVHPRHLSIDSAVLRSLKSKHQNAHHFDSLLAPVSILLYENIVREKLNELVERTDLSLLPKDIFHAVQQIVSQWNKEERKHFTSDF